MEKAGASLSTSLVQWCSFQLLLQFLLSLAPLGSHLPEQQRCRLLHMFSPSSMEQQSDQVLFLRFSRVLESLDLAGCQNCFQVPLLGGWQHICQTWSIVCFMGNRNEYKKTTEEVAQTIFLVKYHKLVFHQSCSIQEPFRVFLFFSFPSFFFFFFSVEMANLHLTLIISFCRNYNSCNVSGFLFFFFWKQKTRFGKAMEKVLRDAGFSQERDCGNKTPLSDPVVDSTKLHAFVVGRTVTLFRLNNTKKWSNAVVIMQSI